MNRMLMGYNPDFDLLDNAPGLRPAPHRRDRRAAFFDAEGTELAAELLDVAGKPDLAALLARLVRDAALASGRRVKSAVLGELVGLLQRAATQVLPASSMPAAQRGGSAATRTSRFFGIELEGLSPEDQEFEAARRFVQLTTEAARQAAQAPQGLAPAAAAQRAAARAAARYAPGWPGPRQKTAAAPAAAAPFAQAGRWLRHGPGVIVLNP